MVIKPIIFSSKQSPLIKVEDKEREKERDKKKVRKKELKQKERRKKKSESTCKSTLLWKKKKIFFIIMTEIDWKRTP